MDDSDDSPISESKWLEGSVASAAAGGSRAPEFIRPPECEKTKASELDGYWQRLGKCSEPTFILFMIASAAHGHLLCAVLVGSTTSLSLRHQRPRVPGT